MAATVDKIARELLQDAHKARHAMIYAPGFNSLNYEEYSELWHALDSYIKSLERVLEAHSKVGR